MSILRTIVLLVLVAATALTSADQGWEPLFDGTSLQGWRASEHPESWQVRDGALVASGPRAHLFYEGPSGGATFRNFELQAEVKTEPGANSGIYFHTAWQERTGRRRGSRCRSTTRTSATASGASGARRARSTASATCTARSSKDGEWFRLHVLGAGHAGAGARERRADRRLRAARPARDGCARARQGTFALQAHDPHSVVAFRNLRVRRLPDDARAQAPRRSPTRPTGSCCASRPELPGGRLPHAPEGLLHDPGRAAPLGASRASTRGRGQRRPGLPHLRRRGARAVPRGDARAAGLRGPPGRGARVDGLFSRRTLERFDYVFTDAMTWTDDDGKRMRLWIAPEVGTISRSAALHGDARRAHGADHRDRADRHLREPDLPARAARVTVRPAVDAARMQRVVDALRANGVGARDQRALSDPERGVHPDGQVGRAEVRLRHQQHQRRRRGPAGVLHRDDPRPAT
jgi:hypothetical protein